MSKTRLVRSWVCGGIAVAALASPVRAQSGDADVTANAAPQAGERAAVGGFLPSTLSARVLPGATATSFAGYDESHDGATAMASADVRLFGPIGVRAGVTYLSALPRDEGAWQPHVMVRGQVLRQAAHGLDLTLGAAYRLERFTPDAGMLQASVAVGRRWDRIAAIGNLAYGQDPEGDDREGDVRVAALYEATEALHVGMEGRARFDLFSNDQRRAARSEHELDFAVGPVAALSFGTWALLAQAGLAGARVVDTKVGALAQAGVGAAF